MDPLEERAEKLSIILAQMPPRVPHLMEGSIHWAGLISEAVGAILLENGICTEEELQEKMIELMDVQIEESEAELEEMRRSS